MRVCVCVFSEQVMLINVIFVILFCMTTQNSVANFHDKTCCKLLDEMVLAF